MFSPLPASPLRNIRLLAIFNFLCDFRLYGPLAVIYFADVSGSYVLGGLVLSVTMISSALLEIPTGVLSDRAGRRRTAVVGAVATTAAIAVYAMAPTFWMLVVGAVLEGLARSLFSGNNDALLYDSLKQEGKEGEFAKHSGHVSSMFQVALSISALLGGFLGAWSLRAAVIASVVPQLLSIVVAWRFVEPTVHGPIEGNAFGHIRTSFMNIRRNRLLRRMVLANALNYGSGEVAFQFQPAFVATLWPAWAVGAARTANNGFAFISFRLSGRVIGRFGPTRSLFGGQVWANIANLAAVVKPTIASPALIASESVTYGVSIVAQKTLLQQEFSDRERATMGSFGSLLGSIVFATLAIGTGYVADIWNIQVALIVLQMFGLATLPLYWSVHRHHKGR